MDRPTDRTPEPSTPSAEEAAGAPPTAERLERRRRATIVKVVLALALLVLFVIFVIQNSEPVPVSFVFTRAEIPLVWVFLGCALVGAAVAYLVGWPGRRAMRRYIRDLERRRGEEEAPGRAP
jgi:uncharacterized integral membrane protein